MWRRETQRWKFAKCQTSVHLGKANPHSQGWPERVGKALWKTAGLHVVKVTRTQGLCDSSREEEGLCLHPEP